MPVCLSWQKTKGFRRLMSFEIVSAFFSQSSYSQAPSKISPFLSTVALTFSRATASYTFFDELVSCHRKFTYRYRFSRWDLSDDSKIRSVWLSPWKPRLRAVHFLEGSRSPGPFAKSWGHLCHLPLKSRTQTTLDQALPICRHRGRWILI